MVAESKRGGAAAGAEGASVAVAALRSVIAHAFGDGALVEPGDGEPLDGAAIHLSFGSTGGDALLFGFDKAGAAALLTRLFRSGALERTRPLPPEQIEAALSALIARAAFEALGLELSREVAPRGRTFVRSSCVVRVGAERFVVSLAQSPPESGLGASARLRLPLVVAVSAAPRAELEAMALGDVWLPESGWLSAPLGFEQALLALPGGEHGLWVVLRAEGARISGPEVRLDALCQTTPTQALDASWARVQIEVGHVELTLAELSSLAAGQALGLARAETAWLVIDGARHASGHLEQTGEGFGLRIDSLGGPGVGTPGVVAPL